MTNDVDIYLASKQAICDLVTAATENTQVPACPKWTLRDLLAHQVGAFHDLRTGNMEGFATPSWTAAQVKRFVGQSSDDIKRAWDDELAAAGDQLEETAGDILPDIAIHEFDARGAVGDTSNRDAEILRHAFAFTSEIKDRHFREANVPALRVIADDSETVLGDGEPQGELRASRFELSRVIMGRRSVNQIRALAWSTDPGPWLEHISILPLRETDLIE